MRDKSISRVLYLTIIYLGLLLPYRLQRHTRRRDGQPHKSSYSVLLQVGFTEPLSHLSAGEPLPHLSTLTGQLGCLSIINMLPAVYFCCTILRVTSTGSYPAPCPTELGLSSPGFHRQRLSGLLARNIISQIINKCNCYLLEFIWIPRGLRMDKFNIFKLW